MADSMGEQALGAYAEAQAAYAHQLLQLHRRDGTGCCQCCGRVHPCDERIRAGHLIAHFGDWAIDSR